MVEFFKFRILYNAHPAGSWKYIYVAILTYRSSLGGCTRTHTHAQIPREHIHAQMQLLTEGTKFCEWPLYEPHTFEAMSLSFKGCVFIVTITKKRVIKNSWNMCLFSRPPSGALLLAITDIFQTKLR